MLVNLNRSAIVVELAVDGADALIDRFIRDSRRVVAISPQKVEACTSNHPSAVACSGTNACHSESAGIMS